MKRIFLFMFIISTAFINYQCKTADTAAVPVEYRDSLHLVNPEGMTLTLLKGSAFNHPTFVIWVENMQGEYLKTLFITRSYASGIFGHQMLNDSTWLPKEGSSYQPGALPYWTHKKGLIDGQTLIPTPQHPFTDAYSGATPQGDFNFKSGLTTTKSFRILLEVNQTWDWNEYWTNNKYPGNAPYSHSAQPSLVYATTVTPDDTMFFLNPIGHGDPKGASGKLFTDLSGMTTAKEIFKQIKFEWTKK